MILVYLIVILLTGAFLAWIAGKWNSVWPRIISVIALSVDLILIISCLSLSDTSDKKWLIEFRIDWIPQFGIGMHLALDGLSLLMLLLTFSWASFQL